MEKFDSKKYSGLIKGLPFSYCSLPLYLDFKAYLFERNGEKIIVWQDLLYPNDFPSIFLPKKKVNWERGSFGYLSEDDLRKIEKDRIEIKVKNLVEEEYFYETKYFINFTGKKAKEIRRFERKNKYKILNKCSKDRILKLFLEWKNQRKRNQSDFADEEGDKLFRFTLNNLKKYSVKEFYVEINGKLVGLAWGVKHPRGGWVSLQLKTLYKYEGLAHFLRREMARYFKSGLFTTGSGCQDPGIKKYKISLGPEIIESRYYILTGDKVS